ncbi:MAG: TaqI-like C-terminal specificity domain-containing protein, partial [Deltaproteobacteria bacterium]
FTEKGFDLLKQGGRLGFICPHKFLNSDFGSGLRTFLAKHLAIESFISFGHNLVFEQASVYTGILVLRKGCDGKFQYHEIPDIPTAELPVKLNSLQSDDFATFSLSDLGSAPWILTSSAGKTVLSRIARPETPAQEASTLRTTFDNIVVGIQSGIDRVHILRFVRSTPNGTLILKSERSGGEVEIEEELVKPLLTGEDVKRYCKSKATHYCIYPYKLSKSKTLILEETELKERFPNGYAYLKEYSKELTEIRKSQKTNPRYWYSCHRGRSMSLFEQVRIITPEISLGCNMTIDRDGLYHNTKVYSLLPPFDSAENVYYWLGVLNSKIMWWFLKNTGYVLRGGYFTFKTKYLEPFPLRRIDFSIPTDKILHDQVVSMVDRTLELHNRLSIARTPQEKSTLERQIVGTDAELDRVVYELYGLTDEEIRIVEGSASTLSVNV